MVAYIMVETGPPRVMLIVSFAVALYSASICFVWGLLKTNKLLNIKYLQSFLLFLGISVLLFHTFDQYRIIKSYTKANDTRIEYLKSLNKKISNDTLILLQPLPPSGMIYSNEISTNKDHFTNQELIIGYDLHFQVAKKAE